MIWVILFSVVFIFYLVTVWRAERFEKRAALQTPAIGSFVNVDGIKFHYLVKGQGPALMILHGAGGNLKDFTYSWLDTLSENYTVILFDRLGHGHSDQPKKSGASLTLQADLAVKLAKELGHDQAYVMGYSYGGALGLHMAINHRDFVKGLTLVSSVSMPWPGRIHFNYRLAAKPVVGFFVLSILNAYFKESYFRKTYKSIFSPARPPKGYLKHVGVNLSIRRNSFSENAKQLNNLRDQIVEQSKFYSELTLPIEMVHGLADLSVPPQIHSQKFIKHVPHARLVLAEGVGHGAHHLAPDEIHAAIRTMRDKAELPN